LSGVKQRYAEWARLEGLNSWNERVRANQHGQLGAGGKSGDGERGCGTGVPADGVRQECREFGSEALGLSEVDSWILRPSDDGCAYFAAYVQGRRRASDTSIH